MLDAISTRLDTARADFPSYLVLYKYLEDQLVGQEGGYLAGFEILPPIIDCFGKPKTISYTLLLQVDDRHSFRNPYVGSWKLVKGPELLGQITHKLTPLGLGQVWRSEMASPVNQWTITVRKELGNGTPK